MKLNRTQNTIRNTAFGLLNKVVTILGPFLVRTVFIKVLGVDYLGLNSLFTSILSVLSLTELGFSSAIVFSMYKPIAEDDAQTINALLYFYRRVYACVGTIILGLGLLLVPFLEYFIRDSEYPGDVNLTLIYLVYLFNTVISYFLFAYLQVLISAHQREDLVSRVNIVISLVVYILQISMLLGVKNYYAYLLTLPILTIANNLRTAYITRKHFPQYRAKGKLDPSIKKDIKEKVSGIVVQKLCGMTRNSLDSIFISRFIGLVDVGIYNNYYYIMNAILGIMSVFTTAMTAGVGNSIAMESTEKNYKDMTRLNFGYMWIGGWFTICLLCLYQPFMKLWVGEELLFPFGVVPLLCMYFYVLKMGDIRSVYDTAKGLWWYNRYRAIAEAIANLVLNLTLVIFFGIYGVIAATLLSLFFINFCYGSQIIFKYYFKEQSFWEYFRYHGMYALVTMVVGTVTFFLCSLLGDSVLSFVGKVLFCAVVPNLLYFALYSRTKLFHSVLPWYLDKLPKPIRMTVGRITGRE